MKPGFTLLELIIVLAITSLVIPIIYGISEGVVFSTTALTATNDIKLINQKLISDIKIDVVQSAMILDDNSSYKNMVSLNMPSNFTQLNRNKLPIINETGSFPPNSANVGNVLFMVRYLNPIDVTVQIGSNSKSYRLDTYRFVYYFLAKDNSYKIKERNPIVLLRAQSREIYVDYLSINNITDNNEKKALVTSLYNRDMRYAIDLRSAKFYELRDNGNISLVNNHQIQMDSSIASKNFRVNTYPTGSVYYAMGYNGMGSIPKFANVDNTGDKFPNGFEIAVVGPRSSRDVLIRSVVVAHISGKVLENESVTIISVPQF
ncbi:MAG: prepilin-type N-terminal cleavage/methylation domain-containing protein [bacterium]|nr:prepilin-type N-terminal cleavage/methylation domain-containing protein [bacterium]